MLFRSFILVFFILISISFVSAIGISPAIKTIDFLPGQEVNITFYVLDVSADAFHDVYFRGGDLIQYSSLSTDVVQGQGSFILTIRFPDFISEPGEHSISVGIKERSSESSFINTVIEVGSTIKVFSPYFGAYGELSLNIPDGNVNDKIPIELHVINRGNEVLAIDSVFIDFISNGKTVSTMNFTSVDISVNGDRYFRKYLDTEGIVAGDYIAHAFVSYSDVMREINKSFRVGSLFVNITNYTSKITSGGIQKFQVSLENRWNSPILGAYVDVNLTNSIGEHYFFRTPSVDLNPWEKATIESYFDTDNLEGSYNVVLNASYNGKSTVVYGNLLVLKNLKWVIYSVIIILILLVLYFVFRHFKKQGKKK